MKDCLMAQPAVYANNTCVEWSDVLLEKVLSNNNFQETPTLVFILFWSSGIIIINYYNHVSIQGTLPMSHLYKLMGHQSVAGYHVCIHVQVGGGRKPERPE